MCNILGIIYFRVWERSDVVNIIVIVIFVKFEVYEKYWKRTVVLVTLYGRASLNVPFLDKVTAISALGVKRSRFLMTII